MQESDIVGLISDLGARPLKGPGYAAGRVAFVNPTGAIETVTGTPTDCVRVDGSSGPCGGTQPNFVDSDAPGRPGGWRQHVVHAVRRTESGRQPDGLSQRHAAEGGAGLHRAGNQIQFVAAAAPQAGDTLMASYRLTGGCRRHAAALPESAGAVQRTRRNDQFRARWRALGRCNIPAGFLAAGDRVEIRFDLEHTGTAGGFSFEVHWGATTLLARNASALDAQATGRAEAALTAAGAQLSHQSWGTSLAFAAGVGKSTDDFTAGVTVDFRAKTDV